MDKRFWMVPTFGASNNQQFWREPLQLGDLLSVRWDICGAIFAISVAAEYPLWDGRGRGWPSPVETLLSIISTFYELLPNQLIDKMSALPACLSVCQFRLYSDPHFFHLVPLPNSALRAINAPPW